MQDRSQIGDPNWRPRAADGLETDAVADGCVVYQPDRERVHHLNHTAAVLLGLCTGENRVADMPELLRSAFDLAAPPTADTHACLEQLAAEGLII